jgi:hypothetical protein
MTEAETAARQILANDTDLTLNSVRAGEWSVTDKAGRVLGAGDSAADALAATIGGPSRLAKKGRTFLCAALMIAHNHDEALEWMTEFVDDNTEDDGDEDSDDSDEVEVEHE